MIEEILWFIDTGSPQHLDCIGEFLKVQRGEGEPDSTYRARLKDEFWNRPMRQINESDADFRKRLLSTPPRLSRP